MADTSLVFNILARDKASKAFDKVKAAAAAAFAVGAAAAVAFGKHALSAGADLDAAMGATNQVFGDSAAAVLDWSKTTADSFGIARSDALAAAKDFGAFFTAIGMSAPAAADLSKEWVAMSANLAAFRDVDPTQALEAMQSALRGELDPIQNFIPSINAAAIEQRALAMTGKEATKELTQQEKALALNALMMESVANTAGAAELAQDGFGVQSARLQAKLKDTSAEIGQKLLPYALKLTEWALGAVNWMKEHEGLVKAIVGVLGGFAVIIGTIIAITKIWTIVQTALNVVMMLNPIGLIILAVVALIAIIVLIATKTTWFKDLWNAAWGWIKTAASKVWDWLKALPGKIGSAFGKVKEFITAPFKAAFNAVAGLWNRSVGKLSFSVPGWVPGLGGKSFSLPKLPMLAKGGHILGAGMAIVGEAGPELLHLPRGATVAPLNRAGGEPSSGSGRGVTLNYSGGGTALDDMFVAWFHRAVRTGRIQLAAGGAKVGVG